MHSHHDQYQETTNEVKREERNREKGREIKK
jgi:hypothetical protein